MNRREFIRISGSLGAGAVAAPSMLSGCARIDTTPGQGQISTTPTICEICFWKCAGVVHQEDGRAWKVTGNPNDLHSQGRLCTRGTGGLGAYLDRDRLKTPQLRVTEGGKQHFKAVSWDEALNAIAERMRATAERHGPERVALFSHGSGGAHFKHLFRAYGSASHGEPSFAQCRGPREVAFRLTFGESVGSPERMDMDNARCIVLIGSHIGENLHNGQVQSFTEALRRGARVITVDPRFSVAASKSRHWLPIRPGTDTALLLAWMHVLIGEGLYDRDYIARYATGLEELTAHVRDLTPEWAAGKTGISADTIRETAREMARNAPATVVHPGRHVTWYGDDTQRLRAIAILNALLGSWGREGGFYIPEKVDLPDYPLPAYPKPKSDWRAANRGLFPLAYTGVTNAMIDASIGPDAHFKGWFVYGTNLPFSVPGVSGKLEQAAQSLDFIVAVDIQPAEITGYADIVLPECTYLERYDDLRNSPERAPSLALRMPAFVPRHDSRPGWWIAKQLGHRLGLEEYFPWQDYTQVLGWQLEQVGSSLAEMQRIGVKNFPRTKPMYFAPGESIRFHTPSGRIELYSSQLASLGFDPIPRYTPPDEPPDGHLRLIYGRQPAHSFGRTSNNPLLYQLMPENTVWVNPQVAAGLALENGAYVRLKNQDGVLSNPVRVRVTERIGPDAVFMAHGFGHTSRGLRLTVGIGANDNELLTRYKSDPIMGGTGMRGNFVTLVKEAA